MFYITSKKKLPLITVKNGLDRFPHPKTYACYGH